MPDGFPRITQAGHPINRIVQYQSGVKTGSFMMVKKLSFDPTYPPGNQGYVAYFNDGVTQDLPGGYVPPFYPPDYKSPDRVKKYFPPPQLTKPYLERVRPSQFSGLMRTCVGSYHGIGKDAPLSHKWEKTHGILKAVYTPTPVPPLTEGTPITGYWLVEVSPGGLYVGRIKVVNNFEQAPSFEEWMPTKAEVEDDPSKQQYRDQVSLEWAFFAKNNALKIHRLIMPGAVTAYNYGSPWLASHGWAFSASGKKIQQVVQSASGYPSPHFNMSRFRITLSVHPESGEVTCPLGQEKLEENKPYTPWIDNILWVPTDGGLWAGTVAAAAAPNFVDFPSQDAPIFVYYRGEDEKVARYVKTPDFFTPAFQTPDEPHPEIGRTITWNTVRYIVGPTATRSHCYPPKVTYTPSLLYDGGTGVNNGSWTQTNKGYLLDDYYGVKEYYSARAKAYVTTITVPMSATVVQSYGNFYTLSPECVFLNESGTPVTACGSGFTRTDYYKMVYTNSENTTESAGAVTAMILFFEERESVLFIDRTTITKTGTYRYNEVWQDAPHGWYYDEIKTDTGPCPYQPINGEITGGLGGPAMPPSTADIGSWSNTDFPTRGYALMLPSGVLTGAFDQSDFNIGTFLLFSPFGKTTASSDVFVMHGNLMENDSTIKPPDQRKNAAYKVTAIATLGGFAVPPGAPISFVGKA